MGMGEVFDFKTGKRIEENPDLSGDSLESNEGVATELFQFIDESKETKKANLAKAFVKFYNSEEARRIENFQTNREAYSVAQETLKDYTVPQMIIWLIFKTTEADRQKNPSFSRALLDKLKLKSKNGNFNKKEWEYEDIENKQSNLRKL